MSVRTGQRGHHIREIYEAATPAVSYTLDRCVQEKNFPKSQRWLLASPIAAEATAYFSSLAKARADEDYAPERVREHALDAREHLISLISLVELAYNKYHFSPDTFTTWTKQLYDNKVLLENYIRS